MKKLIFPIFLAALAFFQACEKDQYYSLDESILPYFKKGDTLIYQSNQSEDTFCVLYKYFHFARENNESHDYYQCCELSIYRVPVHYNEPTGEITAPNDSSFLIRLIGYRAEISWKYFHESASKITDTTITYTIGNHQISNVFVLICQDEPNHIVYFNYNYGIIAYNFGELFELKEKYLEVGPADE